MKHKSSVWFGLGMLPALASVAVAAPDLSKLPPAASKENVTYAQDIRPLFEASCVRCHGAERPKAGLRLDSLEGVLKGGKEGKVVVAGQSAKSKLVISVAQIDPETAMPPKPRAGRRGQGGQPGGPPPAGGQPGGAGGPPPGGGEAGAPGNPPPPGGGRRGPQGPPPKPLTAEQVGLVRAWIDQGAK